MQTIQHILCPTDFSETAEQAMRYADQLAAEAGAELTLVHAFDTPATWTLAGQEHSRDPRLQQQLDALLADSPHSLKIHRLQHAGDAGKVICWMAQDRHCDLIVMGTHGRTGLRHLLFGSVAEYVLRHARCPVITIRDRDPHEPPLPQPIVMPIPPPRFM
jgi:universal stress protein A